MAGGIEAGATLVDRVALVTGATGGIGTAICRQLAAAGARVAVSDLAGEGCRDLAEEIGGIPVALDVTSSASAADAVAETGRALGRISILVNNAGIDHFGRFSDGDEALWERLWAVNLRGVLTVNAVAPGPVETPMMQAAEAKMGEERTRAALRAIPAGRAGTPGDIAAAVVFLASPGAAYITGATLPVSGGLAMV
jgi:3-oxoacyl-[acyl-carrier protein] reductase